MKENFTLITRKIELRFTATDKAEKIQQYQRLQQLSDDAFRAANLVVSRQYFNEVSKEIAALEPLKGIDAEIKTLKATQKGLKAAEKAQKEAITLQIKALYQERSDVVKAAQKALEERAECSQQNITYQLLAQQFPMLPSYVYGSINNTVYGLFRKEYLDVVNGKVSLRTFKRGMPIPFTKTAFRFSHQTQQDEKGKDVENIVLNVVDLSFRLNFGRDKSNNRAIVERVMQGVYPMSDSSIQYKDGDIYLLLVVAVPNEKPTLDPNVVVGVNLGMNTPAYCALVRKEATKGKGDKKHTNTILKPRLGLGSAEDFARVRIQMQQRRRQMQQALQFTNGGHGRNAKCKALDALREKEQNFAKTYNHQLSQKIVDFALKNQAGVIHLENLTGIAQSAKGKGDETANRKNQIILRNWGYYQLQEMVSYKAKRYGIIVRYVDPTHHSQHCAVCGSTTEGQYLHIEKWEKEQEKAKEKENRSYLVGYDANEKPRWVFRCLNPTCSQHGKAVHGDYNNSLNVAQSSTFVKGTEVVQEVGTEVIED